MKRRDFLKQASIAALGASVARVRAANKRIAFGGIQIECSTYGNILSRMEDFTVRRGQELADLVGWCTFEDVGDLLWTGELGGPDVPPLPGAAEAVMGCRSRPEGARLGPRRRIEHRRAS
mgnify:CR=1 FL=1